MPFGFQLRPWRFNLMTMNAIAATPQTPYYAVIFTSQRTGADDGYDAMARRMVELASQQPGFLGIESVRGADGMGITVSYWENEAAIAQWKAQGEHRVAQAWGKATWYGRYQLRVCKVEREYGFQSASEGA